MLIYEKNNKLNINFDNEISENPDLQICKNGDKTEVLVDGSSNPAIPVPVLPEDVGKTIVVNEDGSYALANAGGGSESFVVTFSGMTTNGDAACDKTFAEISAAYVAGKDIVLKYHSGIGLGQSVTIFDLHKAFAFINNALITVGGNFVDYVDNRVFGFTCMINENGVRVEEY